MCPEFSVEKNGDHLVNFSREEISLLAEPFDFTLIGKFSAAIPHISLVAPTLKSLPLKGNFNVSFMDTGLLCLRLFLEEDYMYLKLKGALFIADCYMSVLEWSPYVDYAVDSPIVPVWLTLKNVPFMFFQCEALYKISKLLGNPIRVDDATANMSRLDRVRVCVELDVSKPLLDSFYLVYLDLQVEIKVCYDFIPVFCGNCSKLGHEKKNCLKPAKEKCGVSVSPLASSGSEDSTITSHSGISGSKDVIV